MEIKLHPGALHVFDAPNLPTRALMQLRTEDGTAPLVGTDAAGRRDALAAVPAFLRRVLSED